MKIVVSDNNRYELDKIEDNGRCLTIYLHHFASNQNAGQMVIQTQGNYQYAVLDELTCSYLDFPIAQKEGLVTQYSFSEWDLFQIQSIGEHYRWSYFCVNTEHQIIVIISDCEPIVV